MIDFHLLYSFQTAKAAPWWFTTTSAAVFTIGFQTFSNTCSALCLSLFLNCSTYFSLCPNILTLKKMLLIKCEKDNKIKPLVM